MSLSFETLNLNPSLIEGLAKQNITTPTTIQIGSHSLFYHVKM